MSISKQTDRNQSELRQLFGDDPIEFLKNKVSGPDSVCVLCLSNDDRGIEEVHFIKGAYVIVFWKCHNPRIRAVLYEGEAIYGGDE